MTSKWQQNKTIFYPEPNRIISVNEFLLKIQIWFISAIFVKCLQFDFAGLFMQDS